MSALRVGRTSEVRKVEVQSIPSPTTDPSSALDTSGGAVTRRRTVGSPGTGSGRVHSDRTSSPTPSLPCHSCDSGRPTRASPLRGIALLDVTPSRVEAGPGPRPGPTSVGPPLPPLTPAVAEVTGLLPSGRPRHAVPRICVPPEGGPCTSDRSGKVGRERTVVGH